MRCRQDRAAARAADGVGSVVHVASAVAASASLRATAGAAAQLMAVFAGPRREGRSPPTLARTSLRGGGWESPPTQARTSMQRGRRESPPTTALSSLRGGKTRACQIWPLALPAAARANVRRRRRHHGEGPGQAAATTVDCLCTRCRRRCRCSHSRGGHSQLTQARTDGCHSGCR